MMRCIHKSKRINRLTNTLTNLHLTGDTSDLTNSTNRRVNARQTPKHGRYGAPQRRIFLSARPELVHYRFGAAISVQSRVNDPHLCKNVLICQTAP